MQWTEKRRTFGACSLRSPAPIAPHFPSIEPQVRLVGEKTLGNSWSLRQYVSSCGLLLLPVLIWNLAFWRVLPPAFAPGEFSRDIPPLLAFAENTLRFFAFALPFFMPLQLSTQRERVGFLVFSAGTAAYFASWIALIASPTSAWATSAVGFVAPAYTPVIWFTGIAVVGSRLYWGRAYRWWMYLGVTLLFLLTHVAHTVIVYTRNY
jgi:hypothetical protein